jgi:hypothetical protein
VAERRPKLGRPADRPNRVQLSVEDFTGIIERAAAREKQLRAACAAALADVEGRLAVGGYPGVRGDEALAAQLRAALAAKGSEPK